MPLSVLYKLYTNGPTGAHGLPIDLPQYLMYSQFWPLPKPTGYWISGPCLSMSIDQLHPPECSSSQHAVAWGWLHAAHGHACTATYIISKLPDLLCSVYPHWMRKCFLHFNDLYIPTSLQYWVRPNLEMQNELGPGEQSLSRISIPVAQQRFLPINPLEPEWDIPASLHPEVIRRISKILVCSAVCNLIFYSRAWMQSYEGGYFVYRAVIEDYGIADYRCSHGRIPRTILQVLPIFCLFRWAKGWLVFTHWRASVRAVFELGVDHVHNPGSNSGSQISKSQSYSSRYK